MIYIRECFPQKKQIINKNVNWVKRIKVGGPPRMCEIKVALVWTMKKEETPKIQLYCRVLLHANKRYPYTIRFWMKTAFRAVGGGMCLLKNVTSLGRKQNYLGRASMSISS